MSRSVATTEAPLPRDEEPAQRPIGRWNRASAGWALVACALLAASASARVFQERRINQDQGDAQACPIDLAKLPTKLGEWVMIQGSDKQLPELTMRITGGTDHLIRAYANQLTGVSVMILILYGPAEPVMPHTPNVCYPASGFQQGDAPFDRLVKLETQLNDSGQTIESQGRFRSASYWKPVGRTVVREAVYHSFRLGDQWSPDVSLTRASLRRNPGIFKIQVQRHVVEGETLNSGDPIEQFLSRLLPEMEREIRSSTKGTQAVNSGEIRVSG